MNFWHYYRDRPDLMEVREGIIENKYEDQLVCWHGQKGRLEGLRQKVLELSKSTNN